MGAAIADVMVNEPENIEGVEQHIVVVVKFKGTVQKENGFHPVGVIGDQRVNRPGIFPDVAAGPRDPVIFQIAPTSFQRAGRNRATVLVASQHAALLNPEDVRKRVCAHIECQMADKNIFLERHVRRFIFSRANVGFGASIFLYD